MKKSLLCFLACAGLMTVHAQGVYQIPNSDFENWVSEKEPGNGWNSFASAGGSFSFASSMSPAPEKVEGYNSSYAVKLKSIFAGIGSLGANANGNLTTGRVNMGSMTPTNAANYNHTDSTSTNHSLVFAGMPDAVSCMAKFKSGGSEHGRGQFILHDKYDYKDPETSNEAGYESHKIASASILIPETAEWTYFEAGFEYTGNTAPSGEQYILASFTTNPVAGGSVNDELIIDDVKFIYHSELASLNYDGKDYLIKDSNEYVIDAVYDASKLNCTSNGKGATIDATSYNEETAVLTITVQGNDVSVNPTNVHTYTIQFAKPQPIVTEFENDLLVVLNGQGLPNQAAKIQLIQELDSTISLALNNFILGNGPDAIPVGNIKLTNLEITDGKIKASQDIFITAGDDPAYKEEDWLGPMLSAMGAITVNLDATIQSEDQMEAIIEIPGFMGMNIRVNFAETQTYTDGEALNLTTGLTNIAYHRTFPAGWSTICLPFPTSVVAFGTEVKAQEFASVDDKGVNFTEVIELEANKPYLIYFSEAKETPTYFGTEISETVPVSVTYGDFTFCGSYAASTSMDGKYVLAEQDEVQKLILADAGTALNATRAYFTKTGDQPAEIRLNLEGVTTGIGEAEQIETTFTVYTLQGILVRKQATTLNGLPRGIYIINGKKMVVK